MTERYGYGNTDERPSEFWECWLCGSPRLHRIRRSGGKKGGVGPEKVWCPFLEMNVYSEFALRYFVQQRGTSPKKRSVPRCERCGDSMYDANKNRHFCKPCVRVRAQERMGGVSA